MKHFLGLISDRWSRFWFAKGSAHNLAAARIVFSVHSLWFLLSRDLPAMSGLPKEFWATVPLSRKLRYLIFPGIPDIEYALQAVAVAALVAVALGLWPRVSCLLAAVLLYHLAPLENAFWGPYPGERGFGVSMLALPVLAFSPCADVWSLWKPTAALKNRASWEYRWPLLLLQVYLVQIYFFGGFAKLRFSGLHWMEPDNLRNWLLWFNQLPHAAFTTAGTWIAQRPQLLLAIGISTVCGELATPAILFSRRLRVVFLAIAIPFHVGILFTMGLVFPNWPQLLIFVNWDWVRCRMRRADALDPIPELEPASL